MKLQNGEEKVNLIGLEDGMELQQVLFMVLQ
jgi:hypothetical protein